MGMPKRAFLEDSLMLTKQLFPLPAGTVFLRDVRVVHGGCPNNSDSHRWMPSFSFLSHAYLKEMNWLNEHWVFGKIADVHPQNIWKNSVRKIRKEYHYVDGRLLTGDKPREHPVQPVSGTDGQRLHLIGC